MFCGFNLTLKDDSFSNLSNFQEIYNIGESCFKTTKANVRKVLKDSFVFKDDYSRDGTNTLNSDGSIDGTKLRESWFPEVQSDIFISHSHKDEKLAIALSGWLKSKFNLNTFIDSSVWGYADHLLRKLDDDYCYNSASGTYSYEKRNVTTSHVHIMLSTALYNMMDKSQCVFFLNTPNSTAKVDFRDITRSPWIYAELEMTRIIRLKKSQIKTYEGIEKRALNEFMQATYDMNLEHLLDIDTSTLEEWFNICHKDDMQPIILTDSKPAQHLNPLSTLLELALSKEQA